MGRKYTRKQKCGINIRKNTRKKYISTKNFTKKKNIRELERVELKPAQKKPEG